MKIKAILSSLLLYSICSGQVLWTNVNIGVNPNDGTGDLNRTAWGKLNSLAIQLTNNPSSNPFNNITNKGRYYGTNPVTGAYSEIGTNAGLKLVDQFTNVFGVNSNGPIWQTLNTNAYQFTNGQAINEVQTGSAINSSALYHTNVQNITWGTITGANGQNWLHLNTDSTNFAKIKLYDYIRHNSDEYIVVGITNATQDVAVDSGPIPGYTNASFTLSHAALAIYDNLPRQVGAITDGGVLGITSGSIANRGYILFGDGANSSQIINYKGDASTPAGSLILGAGFTIGGSTGSQVVIRPDSSFNSVVCLPYGVGFRNNITNMGGVTMNFYNDIGCSNAVKVTGASRSSTIVSTNGIWLGTNGASGWIAAGPDDNHSIYLREGGSAVMDYYSFGSLAGIGGGHHFFSGGSRLSQLDMFDIANDKVSTCTNLYLHTRPGFGDNGYIVPLIQTGTTNIGGAATSIIIQFPAMPTTNYVPSVNATASETITFIDTKTTTSFTYHCAAANAANLDWSITSMTTRTNL